MATGDKLVNLDVLKNTVHKEVVDLKSALNKLNIYGASAEANSRWPRIPLSVVDGHIYSVRIMTIIGEAGYDQVWIVQGANSLTGDIKTGVSATFTPSGSDVVYLTIRYPSTPASVPVAVFELIDLTDKTGSLESRGVIITSNNKIAICNGDADNLPINSIFGVNAGAQLTHEPFSGRYYQIITVGEVVYGTSSKAQIALGGYGGTQLAYRFNNSAQWFEWIEISDVALSMINNVANTNGLYYVQASENANYPRIVLPVVSGTSYYIKLYNILTNDAVTDCFVNQGDVRLVSSLMNHATAVFTPTGNDPVYLSLKLNSTPSVLPYVVYTLMPTSTNQKQLTATETVITETNKLNVCDGNLDNLPLNTIFGVNPNVAITNQPFGVVGYTIITVGKYFSRTTGDTQIAIRYDNGQMAHRVATSGSAWGSWVFDTKVSRIPGQKISIIGDSISTFDQDGYNIDGYRMAYPYLDVKSVEQTWWMRVIQASGANLEINAAWSGSCATNVKASSGYLDFYDRCNVLGNPDTIFVELGTNDSLENVDPGEYDYTTDYTQLDRSKFRPAYIMGIKALKNNYPNAKIICLILSMTDDYANSIKAIANELGCSIVECRNYTIGDNTVHPGIIGMRQISSKILYPDTAVI